MLQLIFIAFTIAVIAVTYSDILCHPGQLLAPVYKWLYERPFFNHDERAAQGHDHHWLFKLIIHCSKCIAGQIALWSYLYFYGDAYFIDWTVALCRHIAFVCYAITFASILPGLYNRITRKA